MPAQYTDITGGLLQAVEFLNEKGTGRKTILIFSDLEQDLEKGYVRDIEVPFKGFDVVALNVVKLRQDNYDPRQYLARLEHWKGQVEKAGGQLARGERPRSPRQHAVRGGGSRAQIAVDDCEPYRPGDEDPSSIGSRAMEVACPSSRCSRYPSSHSPRS